MYNVNMDKVNALIIALCISSCAYTGKSHYVNVPLSSGASSLLGRGSSESSTVFGSLQTVNHTDQQDISPTIVDDASFNPSPAELQAKKDYERLSPSKKKLLARSIVMATDWNKLYREFNATMDEYASAMKPASVSEAKMSYYGKKSVQADSWIIVEENPYIQSALRNLRRDKDLAPLIGEARQDKCPLFDYLDIFEIVIDNYIELYPTDKRGWDFLWLMMIMEEEEISQFRTIKKLIQQKGLTRFPYGKKIYEMVKDYDYVEATPSGRQPLEHI